MEIARDVKSKRYGLQSRKKQTTETEYKMTMTIILENKDFKL